MREENAKTPSAVYKKNKWMVAHTSLLIKRSDAIAKQIKWTMTATRKNLIFLY